ncbi:MAG: hypothetical protein K2Q45_02705 [Nitrosomonas sp.]|nr:hypothetical protein [Nitrosomonas sp.]
MSNEVDTLQRVLLQISNVLEPLERELNSMRAVQTFAELGITLNSGQVSSLASPMQALVASSKTVLQKAGDLVEAIEAENIEQIVSISVELISQVITAIQKIDQLQTALQGIGGIPASVSSHFAERLFNYLLVRSLDAANGVNEFLELLGILERQRNNVGSNDPGNPEFTISTFHFNELGKWLESPVTALQSHYNWGGNSLDAANLLQRLERLLLHLKAPVFYDDTAPTPILEAVIFQLRPRTDLNPNGLSLSVRQNLSPGKIEFSADDLKVILDLQATLPFGAELVIQPPAKFTFHTSAADTVSGSLNLSVSADRTQAATPYLLIGDPDGSRLEVGKFGVNFGGRIQGSGGQSAADFTVGGEIGAGKLSISFADGDGFITDILSGVQLNSDFGMAFGYNSKDGLFFTGSSALEIQLPLHLNLGPVEVSALTFSVGIENNKFPTAISTDIKAALGPLAAVVENIGLAIDFALVDNRSGNAGPVDISLGFKPPNGVGLSLDVGIVKGGGYLYFDFDKEEYAGALELMFSGIVTVKAIGLITTRMPDGSEGFSLLIILSAEFGTPFQLGFGFTLNAVGGLLGLNRTMELEVIAAGVRTGSINSIMFPDNIIENAPRIISDLRQFFPPAQDVFLIGPMAKLGWGTPTLVSASLGIIVEIPPGNIAILGVLKVALPDEDAALIIIQVSFIGALEVDKQRLWFYASLYDSRVIFLTIDGDMGLLIAWGNDANFVISVGGFHPSFKPPPLPFPNPNRIAINILNESFARIRVEGYFAVTSNTVQFGAKAEVYFGLSAFNISGHVGFDALFQFSPFYFIITISASFDVKVFGVGLFGVHMRGELEGTSPWHIEGEGSISLLFWDIDVPFSHTWGEDENTTLPSIDIMPLITAEFDKLDNWTAELPASSQLLVSLRVIESTSDLILHPVGVLRVNQRAIPLDLDLDKVGNQKPKDAKRLTVEVIDTGLAKVADTKESFATAQYKNLSDANKLSAPSYEKQNAGIELSVSNQQLKSSAAVKRVVRYEQNIIDNNFVSLLIRFVAIGAEFFNHFLGRNAASKSALSANYKAQKAPVAQKIVVKETGYVVASTMNNSPHSKDAYFATHAQAQDFMRKQVNQSPTLQDNLHVIPSTEATLLQEAA